MKAATSLTFALLLALGVLLAGSRGGIGPPPPPAGGNAPPDGRPAKAGRTAGPVEAQSGSPPPKRLLFPAAKPRPGDLRAVARRVLAESRAGLRLEAVPGTLREKREFGSLSGWHLRYEQVIGGVPVLGSEVSVHLARDGRPLLVNADVFPVGGVSSTPRVAASAALETAVGLVEEEGAGAPRVKPPRLVIVPSGSDGWLAWQVDVKTREESVRILVDARTGDPQRVTDLRRYADGSARLFDPNPVYTLRDGTLRDRGDLDSPRLDSATEAVTLRRLDGTGKLRGRWADTTPTSGDFSSARFDWRSANRSDPAFEPLMAYYHVDRLQQLLQDLGIHNANARSQGIDAHESEADNSFYDAFDHVIALGDGGVDDGEDADVIRHEYGHAIQENQVPDFGLALQGRALGEGFGDFLAVAFHPGGAPGFDPLVASWDATAYSSKNPPYLRRTDRDKRYPRDYRGKPHADGEIWSRFLRDLIGLFGRDEALRVVIESHFLLTPWADFRDGANAVLLANLSLRGGRDDAAIRLLLDDRGLPYDVEPAPPPPEDTFEENDTPETAAPVGTGTFDGLLLADPDWFRGTIPPWRRLHVMVLTDRGAPSLALEIRAPAGGLIARTESLMGSAEAVAEAGAVELSVRIGILPPEAGGSPLGYTLVLAETELTDLSPGKTVLLELHPGTTRVFRIPLPEAKVAKGVKIRVRARRAGKRGALPELRLTAPDGLVLNAFGEGLRRKKASVSLQPDEPGAWILELKPREGTEGRVKLKVRVPKTR